MNNATYKRLLFEVGPKISTTSDEGWNNCVIIQELSIIYSHTSSHNVERIIFPKSPVYDSAYESHIPGYWDSNMFNSEQLSDGNKTFVGGSGCLFLYPTGNGWARFQGYIPKDMIPAGIEVYVGYDGVQAIRTPSYLQCWQVLHDDVGRYCTADRLIDDGLYNLGRFTWEEQQLNITESYLLTSMI